MERVGGIKGIFEHLSPDKSTLSVVQVDREKGKARRPAAGLDAGSHDGLQNLLLPQQIHHQDERESTDPVIRLQVHRDDRQHQQRPQLLPAVFPEVLDTAEAHISEKQGKEDILRGVVQGTRVLQIPWDL